MNYEEAVAYLLDIPRFASKSTHENLRGFLRLLGNPQNRIPAIHIAGTNGKGSTCAFLSSILQEAGYQVGVFTSPHLVWINERFQINGIMISNEGFRILFEKVKNAVDAGLSAGLVHPNFFEFLFLMAACWYEEQKPDYVIYETGLGGRLDATNVLKPCLTILTSIGMDHMQYLGNTLEEIAGEKAGILKAGTPCIYLSQKDVTEAVIRHRGEELGSGMIPVEKDKITIDEIREQTIDFSYVNRYDSNDSSRKQSVTYRISKTALYQVENAAIAMEAGYYLLSIPGTRWADREALDRQQVVRRGIAQMKWRGRMEELEPGIYVDGAHNAPAIRAFCDTITRIYLDKKIILLFAVASDKRYNEMIQILCEAVSYEKVIITAIDGVRTTPVEPVRELFRQYTACPIVTASEISQAWELVHTCLRPDNRVFCVGSLYLVGALEAKKEEEP
ncbi:MAG: bifunctional folylpolyglutamate synthase/dihydrofolate synthase [Bacteroides sp.]|nr:bifunctional folylpolyglutamate synthase/dihydrofolate synthase [Bacteroides sp.]MCM1549676.1 bifunctional folylpolyglutamate synthase/dihydrofolate synthase [Clostridium sp.]